MNVSCPSCGPARRLERPARRVRSAAKSGLPSADRETSSPSRMILQSVRLSRRSASSGNSAVQSRPGRDRTQRAWPSKRSWARIPSHFTSIAHASSLGATPVLASAGAMKRGSPSRVLTMGWQRTPATGGASVPGRHPGALRAYIAAKGESAVRKVIRRETKEDGARPTIAGLGRRAGPERPLQAERLRQ